MATNPPKPPTTKGEPPQAAPGRETEMREKPDHGEASYRGYGRLAGRVALITGADSGIGRAVALAFAREGADVAFTFLDEERADADETRRLVEEAGRRALPIAADLSDETRCREVVAETVDRLGHLELLVNNAAVQRKSVERFEDLDAQTIERTFRVNILAMFYLVHAALPHLPRGAAIINVASIQAYKPSPGILDYAATKGAIVTFTKGLAEALAERQIRVNCVAPGPVWTPLVAQSFDEQKLSKFGQNTPLGRPAQPAELAPAFVFLACDESRYIDGEVLGVTGGQLLGT